MFETTVTIECICDFCGEDVEYVEKGITKEQIIERLTAKGWKFSEHSDEGFCPECLRKGNSNEFAYFADSFKPSFNFCGFNKFTDLFRIVWKSSDLQTTAWAIKNIQICRKDNGDEISVESHLEQFTPSCEVEISLQENRYFEVKHQCQNIEDEDDDE